MSEELTPDKMAREMLQALTEATPERVVSMVEAATLDDSNYLQSIFLLRREPEVQEAVASSFRRIGEFAYKRLIQEFVGSNLDRARSLVILTAIGPVAVPALVGALSSPDVRIRSGAAMTLGQIRQDEAIPSLIGSLSDPESTVREVARKALIEITGKRFILGSRKPKTWQRWWEKRKTSPTG